MPLNKNDIKQIKEAVTEVVDPYFVAIQKDFNENTVQHRQIFQRLDRIDKKLEGIVYRKEFEDLATRVKELEDLLAVKH
ncbi:MAG: hypothetical protein HYT20_02315 [Candidatus Nealsonbacteria bacterium]|nr:hypothetical protein [Candidatus Nealsonbacteria bacterium]